MFFVLSCILALTPEALDKALDDNLSVLTVLAERSSESPLAYAGPLISQLALITSFVAHLYVHVYSLASLHLLPLWCTFANFAYL